MSRGAIFFNLGTKCLARLAVALYSLRRHNPASALPVTILNAGDDEGICDRFAADARLAVEVRPIEIPRLRRHTAYAAKPSLWRHSPFVETVYLDSDTVIAAPLDPIFDALDASCGLVFTQFAKWTTHSKQIRGRLDRWEAIAADNPQTRIGRMLERCRQHPQPAVNTGVYAWDREMSGVRQFFEEWEAVTQAGRHTFIADEIAAQLMLAEWRTTVLSDRFNFSPIYSVGGDEKPIIYHQHGGKHCTFDEGRRGHQGMRIFWPIFTEVYRENIASCRDWLPAGDHRLAAHLPSLADAAAV